jgi:hypothetical protein
MANFLSARTPLVLLVIATGWLVTACQPQLQVTTKGSTNIPNRFYSLADPSEVTVLLTRVGTKNEVEVHTGKVEYDGTRTIANHIPTGERAVVFSDSTEQGSAKKDGINLIISGAQGTLDISIPISFKPEPSSIQTHMLKYPKDDQVFFQEVFRPNLQSTLNELFRKVSPVDVEDKKNDISITLQDKLQKEYPTLIVGKPVFIRPISWNNQEITKAIAAVGANKAKVAQSKSDVERIEAEKLVRDAERKAFAEVSDEQRNYELKQQVVKNGGNPFQPSYPPSTLVQQKPQ